MLCGGVWGVARKILIVRSLVVTGCQGKGDTQPVPGVAGCHGVHAGGLTTNNDRQYLRSDTDA